MNKYLHTVASLGFLFTLNYDARNHELKKIHTIEKNIKALLFASKEICLELNADNSTYTAKTLYQNAGRSQYL